MDNWDATVIRQLTVQRHAEDIARGLAAQRRKADLGDRRGARPHRTARRAARFAVITLLAGVLAFGLAGTAAADPVPAGDFCYVARHGGPALTIPRCLPHPLPVAPDQIAI